MAVTRVQVSFRDREVLEFIAAEAARNGCSVSEYMRNAAIARAAVSYARHSPTSAEHLEQVYRAAADVWAKDPPIK